MILLIDNYDSFAYNLYQLIGTINPDIKVIRNDELTVEEIESLNPEKIIISPGPGKPSDAGVCIKTVRYFEGKVPILGVCLGHQAICEAYGATVYFKEFTSFTEQKNFALSKVTKPWALNMDADEYLTPALAEEIAQTIQKEDTKDGYFLIRSTVFLGRHMHHSVGPPGRVISPVMSKPNRW